jgi:hypothetical protein
MMPAICCQCGERNYCVLLCVLLQCISISARHGAEERSTGGEWCRRDEGATVSEPISS